MKKENFTKISFIITLILCLTLLAMTGCRLLEDSTESAPNISSASDIPSFPATTQAQNKENFSSKDSSLNKIPVCSTELNTTDKTLDPSLAEQNLLLILNDLKTQEKSICGIYYAGENRLLFLSNSEGILMDLATTKMLSKISIPDSAVDFKVKPTNDGFALFYLQMSPEFGVAQTSQMAENTATFPAVICNLYNKNGIMDASFNFNQIAQETDLQPPPLFPMHVDVSLDTKIFFMTNMDGILAYNRSDGCIAQIASLQDDEPSNLANMLGFTSISLTSNEHSLAFLGSSADEGEQTENVNKSFSTVGLIPLESGTSPIIHHLPNFAISSFSVSPGKVLFNLDIADITMRNVQSETSILFMNEQNGELIQFPAAGNPLTESTHVFNSVNGSYYATLEPVENNILKTIRIYSSADGVLVYTFFIDEEQQSKYKYVNSMIILDDLRLCVFSCPFSSTSEHEILYFIF